MAEEEDFIAYFARSKGFMIKSHTIFVEGITDVELFQLAAKLEQESTGFDLLGDKLAIVSAGEGNDGGASGVCRELISFRNMSTKCLLPNGRPKYRFVGLFDNDRAGRQAIADIKKSYTSMLEFKDVFRLWPVMPLLSHFDVEGMRKEFEVRNQAYKNLDWELEDLIASSLSEGIINENPDIVYRSYKLNDKVHREWTPDGKAKIIRLVKQYAIRDDLEDFINTIKAFWHYLNIK